MTSATKRKHVVKEMLEDFSSPSGNQLIVQVLGSPGSNLHEVITSDNQRFLCSLPTKFRKNIWIKRGDFVVIEPIHEGDKVKAEIVRILYPEHIKVIEKDGLWPDGFKRNREKETSKNNDIITKISDVSLKEDNPDVQTFRKEDYILNLDDRTQDVDFDEDYSSDDDDLSDIPVNTNRPTVDYEESSSDEEISE